MCSACQSQYDAPAESESSDSGVSETTEREYIPSMKIELDFSDYDIPMEPEYLIENYEDQEAIYRIDYVISDPGEGVQIEITCSGYPDSIGGDGTVTRYGATTSFGYSELQSTQPLSDLREYISEHPDIFFDHTEFEGQEPGELEFPDEYLEAFRLGVQISGVNISLGSRGTLAINNTIQKAVMPGEEVPEELRYVLDLIRTEFAEVIAGHPIPRPQ